MTTPHNRVALVTGANGFIGKQLCQALKQDGWDVTAVLRKPVSGPWDAFLIKDFTRDDFSPGDLADVDVVFHLAASSDTSNKIDISPTDRLVNIEGTQKLLDAATSSNADKIVYLSTVKAMGENHDGLADENSPCHPVTSYGKSKLEAESILRKQDAIPVCIIRLPMVYGSSEHGNLVSMIRAIRKGRFPPIPEVGNKRSMVHVSDVVAAIMLAANDARSNQKLYILTDGLAYSTRQIYNCICDTLGRAPRAWSIPVAILNLLAWTGDVFTRITGKPFVFGSDSLQKLIGSACYSNARICEELDFRPEKTLQAALPEIIGAMENKKA